MNSNRLYVAAQALSDFWIPLRGHRELFLEVELGQAEAMLAAADAVVWSEERKMQAVLAAHLTGGMSMGKCREVVDAVMLALLTEPEPSEEQVRQQIREVMDDDGGS